MKVLLVVFTNKRRTKMSSYKNESTKNPERKWAKKLRNAKTPEQQKKAENMLKALQKKKQTKKDEPQLSDDQMFMEAQEWNLSSESQDRVKVKKNKILSVENKQKTRDRVNEVRNQKIKRQKKEQEIPKRVWDETSTYKVEKSSEIDEQFEEFRGKGASEKRARLLLDQSIQQKCYRKVLEDMEVESIMEEHDITKEEAIERRTKVYEFLENFMQMEEKEII